MQVAPPPIFAFFVELLPPRVEGSGLNINHFAVGSGLNFTQPMDSLLKTNVPEPSPSHEVLCWLKVSTYPRALKLTKTNDFQQCG